MYVKDYNFIGINERVFWYLKKILNLSSFAATMKWVKIVIFWSVMQQGVALNFTSYKSNIKNKEDLSFTHVLVLDYA